ncbi:MAG: cell division protein FtsL [Gammaproteobacteria bacterium]|nr:cell division protein FtsL [Gammaproteobacteria bacterium]
MKRTDFNSNHNSNKYIFITLLLLLSNFIVSMSVIYVRHINRINMAELQRLVAEQNSLYQEWTQLLLEQSTLTSYNRVDSIASKELSMRAPNWDETTLIKIPKN